MNKIVDKYTNKTFDEIKRIDEYENEYWLARELQIFLNYKEWRKFENVIMKAQQSCENSGITISDHFVGVDKMIELAKGAKRKVVKRKIIILVYLMLLVL